MIGPYSPSTAIGHPMVRKSFCTLLTPLRLVGIASAGIGRWNAKRAVNAKTNVARRVCVERNIAAGNGHGGSAVARMKESVE